MQQQRVNGSLVHNYLLLLSLCDRQWGQDVA